VQSPVKRGFWPPTHWPSVQVVNQDKDESGRETVIRTLRFKSCPRCKGNVMVDRDYYGWYKQCLQCGYQRDLKDMGEVQQRQTQEAKRK